MASSTVSSPVSEQSARSRSLRWRRVGYAVAILVNAALLVVVNIAPGWQSWGFLTPQASEVVGLVNASLWAGLMINGLYIVVDTKAVKALGDGITAAFAVAVSWEMLRVFPFTATGGAEWLIRAFFVIVLLGSAIGVVASLARLVAAAFTGGRA